MAILGSTDLGNGYLTVTVDHDPSTTPTDVPAGTRIITTLNPTVSYTKQDDGSSTNVEPSASSAVTTTNPTVTDDAAAGFIVGSRWINTATDEEFVCTDNSIGAAVWMSTTAGGGGGVPPTRTLTAGAGLTGGGDLSANRTFDVGANPDGSITINADNIQVGVLATDAQHGNRGGGALHGLVSSTQNGFYPQSNLAATTNPTVTNDAAAGYAVGSRWVNTTTDEEFVCLDATNGAAVWTSTTVAVPPTRTLTAGAGLTGGGDLSANRTFDVGANPDGSIVVNADNIQVGVLATDAQHGNRGGGALHGLVSSTQNGFYPQSNRTATTNPTISNDSSGGYAVGSRWVNTTTGEEFVCVNASVGAAVWVSTTNAGGSGTALLQATYDEISANTTTTSTTFVTLLSRSITKVAGTKIRARVAFSASNGTNNTNVFFRLTVNGVVNRGASIRVASAGNAWSGALEIVVTGLAAGSHTVVLQWRVSGGTGQIRPVAAPDAESASLVCEEIT